MVVVGWMDVWKCARIVGQTLQASSLWTVKEPVAPRAGEPTTMVRVSRPWK